MGTAVSRRSFLTGTTSRRVAVIGPDCLSLKGVTCRSCKDYCALGAIAFRLALGGVAHPLIDEARCTGCGDCATPCPVGAIALTGGRA